MTPKRLTDCISRETLERLTREAFEGPPRKGARPVKKGLALAACLLLVAAAANFDTVYAAARRLLYFIPGNGPVAEEEGAEGSYWLAEEEYHIAAEGREYTVTYLYRRGTTLFCRVEKEESGVTFPEEPDGGAEAGGSQPAAPSRVPMGLGLEFLDPEGNPIPSEETWSHSVYDQTTGEASAAKSVTLEDFPWEEFTLVLDGTVELPVRLREVSLEDYSMDRSLRASDAGYTLSILPLNGDCTRFALIPQLEDGSSAPEESYWNGLSFDVELLGEDGLLYGAEAVDTAPGCQEFYVPGLPQVSMTRVTVTGILESTRYEDPSAAVRLPPLELGETVELDQRLGLWNVTLLARSAGLDADGRLWVALEEEAGEGRRLNQVDLSWPESEGYGGSVIRDGSYTVYHHGMSGYAGESLELPVAFVSVVQEGEWSFSLSKE